MAGVELIDLKWGTQTLEYSSVWEKNVEVFQARKTNVAGGVDIQTEIYNASDKVIKYITFSYVAYNAVGDVVACSIKKTSVVAGKLVGPIAANATATVVFKNMWYNTTISKIEIKGLTVQYMDDSLEMIAGNELVCVYKSGLMNENSIYYAKRGKAELEAARKKEGKEVRLIFGIIVAVMMVLCIAVGSCFV